MHVKQWTSLPSVFTQGIRARIEMYYSNGRTENNNIQHEGRPFEAFILLAAWYSEIFNHRDLNSIFLTPSSPVIQLDFIICVIYGIIIFFITRSSVNRFYFKKPTCSTSLNANTFFLPYWERLSLFFVFP